MALLLSSVFGCSTNILMARCNSWTYQGLSDDSFQNNYRIGVTISECASKCGCLNNGPLISCESGEKSDCLTDCAKNWDVECVRWAEVPVTIDFITREELKK